MRQHENDSILLPLYLEEIRCMCPDNGDWVRCGRSNFIGREQFTGEKFWSFTPNVINWGSIYSNGQLKRSSIHADGWTQYLLSLISLPSIFNSYSISCTYLFGPNLVGRHLVGPHSVLWALEVSKLLENNREITKKISLFLHKFSI